MISSLRSLVSKRRQSSGTALESASGIKPEAAPRLKQTVCRSRDGLDVDSATLIRDLEARAKRMLPGPVYDFAAGGAGGEFALLRNVSKFTTLAWVPRIMRDVHDVDTSCELLGRRLEVPLLLAPMGGTSQAHPSGDLALAAAARTAGAGIIVSMATADRIEDLAAAAGPSRWLQLYPLRDRGVLGDLTARAADAGFNAICLTVDSPVMGLRMRDKRHGQRMPTDLARWRILSPYGESRSQSMEENFRILVDDSVSWDDLEMYISAAELPVVVKGLLSPSDAVRAAQMGAGALLVSNHGGRQLASVASPIECLSAVMDAGLEIPVIMDGGVRSANDALMAIALGAQAVGIGRPIYWALTGGERVVADLLGCMEMDMKRHMKLLGCPSLADLGPEMLKGAA